MNELLPIFGGLLVGLGLLSAPTHWRPLVGALAAVVVGAAATFASGRDRTGA